MKKTVAFLLMMLMLLGTGYSSYAENSFYAVGDIVEDFTLTDTEGNELTLSELLEEKDMVLVNFWATWCTWCKVEFPFMEEALLEYEDDVAVIAVNCDETEDAATVAEFKESMGLSAIHFADDTAGLSELFDTTQGIPFSAVIDRFGTVCWTELGAITEKDKFTAVFDTFTGDNYSASKVGVDPLFEPPLADGADSYSIIYIDLTGAPVEGVMTQVCTDELCNMLASDASGAVTVENARQPHEVHVLKLPEGYKPYEGTYTFHTVGDGYVIVLLEKS